MKQAHCIISLLLLCSACTADKPKVVERKLTPQEERGRAVYSANCASCHSAYKDATGPALKGSLARWNNDTNRLWAFIRNPKEALKEKDPRVNAMFEKYKPTIMTAFPMLTNDELKDLFYYIEHVPPPPPPGTVIACP
jgi:mono/diheme cytochrome c family protein